MTDKEKDIEHLRALIKQGEKLAELGYPTAALNETNKALLVKLLTEVTE